MQWLIFGLILLAVLEIAAGFIRVGKSQKLAAYLLILLIAIDSLLIVSLSPAVWSSVLLYISIFRIINLAKLVDGRKQANYLKKTFIRATIVLVSFQILVMLLRLALEGLSLAANSQWALLISLELIASFTLLMSLRRTLKYTRPSLADIFTADNKLPALTVAVPARNETEDLDECLKSLIKSDYPKLEILVLDDCSQEKRTPEIIRQFAHDGVRFLAGEPAADSWTAKNYAYEQLGAEASGDVILFSGVDIRFASDTLRKMVELKLQKKKSMVSFMPLNDLPTDHFRRLLWQPMRYLWEVALPRRSLNRPPVLSSCWLIDRKVLMASGSFKAVSRSIIPERYFAREATKDDGYSFTCLGKDLGLISKKSFASQRGTAVRTRYPLLHERLDNVCWLTLLEFVIFILPIGLGIYELVLGSYLWALLSLINMASAALLLYIITRLAYGQVLPFSLVLYPIAFAYDIALNVYSLWRYEFSDVIWKGRNVCIPVMQLRPPQPEASSSVASPHSN